MTDTDLKPAEPTLKTRVAEVSKDLHSTLTVWYMYFVAFAVSLKTGWTEFSTFIPSKWQHIGLGVATFIALADKIRRSIGATAPDATPPTLP